MQAIVAGPLVLEPRTAAHAQEMFELLADERIYAHLDEPAPASVDQLRATYLRQESRASPDGTQRWLNWVVRQPGQAPIGYVQATVISTDTAWVGYVLGPAHWGRGFAHAAMSAMLEHLRVDHGIARWLASVEARNERSIRLLDRLAFRPATPAEAAEHDLTASERLFVRRARDGQNAIPT